MANIKFSQFTQKTTLGTVDFLVGYTGADNIQIDPADLLSDYSQGTGAAGQVTFFSATSTITGDPDLYWNNTNKRLGIGISSPNRLLHVNSNGQTDIHLTTNSQGTSASDGMTVFLDASGSGGLWLRETSDMRFATSGTERVWIKGGGNVGIGTNNPAAKLEVSGTLIASGISQLGSGGNNVYLTSSSAGNVGIGTSSPGAKLQIGSATHAPNSNLTSNFLQIKSPSGFAYLTIGNGDVVDSTAYIGGASGFIVLGSVTDAGSKSEHMRITNIGTIGVGTNDPKARLHVSGSDSTSSAIRQSRVGTVIWDQAIDSSGRLQWGTRATEAGSRTVRFTLDDNGNVGVGTGSPSYPFDVFNTDAPSDIIARFKTEDNSTYIQLVSAGSSWQIGATSDSLDWYNDNNSAVRMSLTETGNLGIGTTSPSEKLSVSGNIIATGSGNTALSVISTGGYSQLITQASDSDSAYIFFKDTSGERARLYSSTSNDLIFKTNGGSTTALTLSNSGDATFANKVGINTAPASGVELHVNGEIRVDGNDGVATRKIRSGYFSSTTDIVVASGSSANVRLQNGNTDGLVIDSSQDATFSGEVALNTKLTFNYGGNHYLQSGTNSLAYKNSSGSSVVSFNANTLDTVFSGDVEIANSSDGIILESPDGTRYRVTVANGGTLSVSAV